MVKYQLEKLKNFPECITFPPCSEEDIRHTSSLLAASGFCAIPQEYKEFLKITDGISYGGLEMFGIKSHNRTEKKYTFPDISSSTFHYKDYIYFKRKLVLGRMSEVLICYDSNTEYYTIEDRVSLRPLKGAASLTELIKIFIDVFSFDSKKIL